MSKYGNECEICKKPISGKAKRCQKHAGMLSGPITNPLPSDKKILDEVKKTSAAAIARKYNVSVTTIKKILLKYPNR